MTNETKWDCMADNKVLSMAVSQKLSSNQEVMGSNLFAVFQRFYFALIHSPEPLIGVQKM